MKAEDVANYLQANPDFFEAYSQMLSEIVIPHPYGGRTISLSERQMLTLRERVKELEKRLLELVSIAKDNDGLQKKLHEFTLSLFTAHDLLSLQNVVITNLRDIFTVPHAALQFWKQNPPSIELMTFTNDLMMQPSCLHQPVQETVTWFGETDSQLRSFAYIPLSESKQSIGLLILASEDQARFYPEMGTVFLKRIAELVSSAFAQLE
jgi:hypothetical protein